MKTAAVGFHCPDCAASGRQQVYTAASLPRANDPILTKVLIGLNVLVFLAAAASGGDLYSVGGSVYIDGLLIGGNFFSDTGPIGVDFGEWWRIVTGGFLHANVMHIGFNMFLLWLLGSELEPFLGRVRFGLLYGASLLAGSFGVLLVDPTVPTVGASGAVFGLMGAIPFFVIGCIAAWRQMQAPSARTVEHTLERAAAMPWREFRDTLEQAYQAQGFTVTRLDGQAADLQLTRGAQNTLVAARRWKAASHGVEPLRALDKARQARDASHGVYVTLGEVNDTTRRFAEKNAIALVNGVGLVQLLGKRP